MKHLLFIALLLLPAMAFSQATETFWMQAVTDVHDGYINVDQPTTNHGSTEPMVLGTSGGARHILVSFPTLNDTVNAFGAGWVVSEMRLDLYFPNVFVNLDPVVAYYVVKPYIEAQATWNRWDDANSKEWGGLGGGLTDTGSDYNEGDGLGTSDRGGTSQGSVTVTSTGWKYIDLDTAWINASIALDSILVYNIRDEGGGASFVHSSEYATDTSLTLRLRVIMEELAVEGVPNVRHSPAGQGQRHGPDGASVRHEP